MWVNLLCTNAVSVTIGREAYWYFMPTSSNPALVLSTHLHLSSYWMSKQFLFSSSLEGTSDEYKVFFCPGAKMHQPQECSTPTAIWARPPWGNWNVDSGKSENSNMKNKLLKKKNSFLSFLHSLNIIIFIQSLLNMSSIFSFQCTFWAAAVLIGSFIEKKRKKLYDQVNKVHPLGSRKVGIIGSSIFQFRSGWLN